LLKAGFLIAAAAAVTLILLSWKILPYYPDLVAEAQSRSLTFYEALPPADDYASYATIAASIFYALIVLITLFYLFEKTQSVEVHFFFFFVFSFVFEILRIGIPVRLEFNLSGILLGAVAHTLVFFRYFGLFSLFAASLYASGLKIEKEESIILPLIVVTLFLSLGVPVNTFTWDTSLFLANGYPTVFRVLECTIALFTGISFFIGAWARNIKEYYFVGIGSMLAVTGRLFLINGDTYLLPAAGFILLMLGTYLICSYLRKIYLWV
jgi:hypothetical protein